MTTAHPETRSHARRRRRRADARAFTLVELLIVVAIIALLVGISLPALSSVYRNNAIQSTQSVLQQLDVVAERYEQQTGRILRVFPNDAGFFDWSEAKTPNAPGEPDDEDRVIPGDFREASIERFVWATYRIPDIRRGVYGSIDETYLQDADEDGFLGVIDAWGTPVIYKYDPNDDIDGGGDYGDDDFLPESREPYFASAGPDRRWGDVTGNATEQEQAEDNLYSIELD